MSVPPLKFQAALAIVRSVKHCGITVCNYPAIDPTSLATCNFIKLCIHTVKSVYYEKVEELKSGERYQQNRERRSSRRWQQSVVSAGNVLRLLKRERFAVLWELLAVVSDGAPVQCVDLKVYEMTEDRWSEERLWDIFESMYAELL